MKRAYLAQAQKLMDKFPCEFHAVGALMKSTSVNTQLMISIL